MLRLIDGDQLIEWLEANERNGRVLNLPDVRFIVSELAKDNNVPRNGWITTWDNKRKKYVTSPLPEPPKEEDECSTD